MPNPFDVDPCNYFGNDYEDHVQKCLTLSLAKPADYQAARANVTKILKREIMKNWFKNISSVLATGYTSKGESVYGTGGTVNPTEYPVAYPNQKITDLCLSYTKTIDSMMQEVVDIVLPRKINHLNEEKMANMGKASLL